jgi:hypothetical protein
MKYKKEERKKNEGDMYNMKDKREGKVWFVSLEYASLNYLKPPHPPPFESLY